MSGTDVAGDVPTKFDCVIDGFGYVTARAVDPNMPFRVQQQNLSYTPTFLERTNVSGNYGDDAQAFFLTASQNDWSLGEGRRYFRSQDEDGSRRYWTGTNVDPVSTPGQVMIRRTTPSLSFAASVLACTEDAAGIYATTSTNLYLLASSGAITDKGAHGLGATPSAWGITGDSVNIYLSTTAGGTVGVRKWNGASYSTFSATGADSLAYLNNTLYGYSESTGILSSYSSTGVATTIFTWKDAAGAALTGATYAARLRGYGGKLLILRKQGYRRKGELWQYDGTNTATLADFPANFSGQEMEVVSGIVLVSGYLSRNGAIYPAIYYYAGGQLNQAWVANVDGYANTTWPAITAFGEGFVFTDDTTGHLMQYHIGASGVHTLGTYTVTNATAVMAANKDFLLHTRNATTAYYYPSTTVAATATITTSLFDFDSSLKKYMRGVRVEFDSATDGDGGSVDIAYQYGSNTGAFSSLQVGAAAGTEYALDGTRANSVSLKITLNKGTSTYGPVLKRIYVRGAPVLTSYRINEYIFDLGGDVKTGVTVKRRDGSDHNLSGEAMRANLVTSIQAVTPISVTDRTGTFTAVLEPANCEFDQTRPGQWYARIRAREV